MTRGSRRSLRAGLGVRGASLALLGVLCALGSTACRRTAAPQGSSVPSPDSPGQERLPPGCATVATVSPAALGPIFEALRSRLSADMLERSELVGVDFKRDLRRVSYCGMPTPPGERPRYAVVLSGHVRPDLLDAVSARGGGELIKDDARHATLTNRDGRWMALRQREGGDNDLIVASSRELLDGTLGASAHYGLDFEAPLSIVIEQRAFSHLGVPANSGFEAVRAITANLRSGNSAIDVRMTIGNPTEAERMAPEVRGALVDLARQLTATGSPAVSVSASAEAGDVVARIELPPHTLDMLASRLSAPRP